MNQIPESILGSIAQVAAGLILVFFGRRLFWFFVGVVGFLVGFRIGLSMFPDSTMAVVMACAVGVIAALLSVVLEKVLIVLAGLLPDGSFAHIWPRFWGREPKYRCCWRFAVPCCSPSYP